MLLISLLYSIFLIKYVSEASSVPVVFNNDINFHFDTDGDAIDSTSGKIDFLNGEYVWYGLAFACGSEFCGIHSYSSPDLTTWSYNGFLFDPNTTEISTLCAIAGNCGRPHIVYSSATKTYVLWVNSGSPGYVIFTSSTPTSGYAMSSKRASIGYQPAGTQGGDFSVAIINGTGYLAYSLIDFNTVGASIWPPFLQSLYLQPLTPSMTNTTGNASHVVSTAGDLVDFETESPDIFKRGDFYYVSASNTCGFCTETILIIYRSKSPTGPWIRQIISADTCGGQSGGVLTLPSPDSLSAQTTYLHQADLISTAPLTGTRTAAHGHQFQVLNFNADGSVQDLNCSNSKAVTVSIEKGNSINKTGLVVTATDESGQLDIAYNAECLLPRYQLYQTWTSSKTGILTEVGFNYAGNNPTGNLSITVFRHQNDTDLQTPRYVWETLSTLQVTPLEISRTFKVIRVPVGASVKAGDKLGIALVSGSETSSCILLTDGQEIAQDGEGGSDLTSYVSGTGNNTLYANGINQVSPRGKHGKTSPVVIFPGQIKWYSIVH